MKNKEYYKELIYQINNLYNKNKEMNNININIIQFNKKNELKTLNE